MQKQPVISSSLHLFGDAWSWGAKDKGALGEYDALKQGLFNLFKQE